MFNGTTWTQIDTPVAPSPRTNVQMAYDRHTHQIVPFGGYDGHRDLSDTWLWDGLADVNPLNPWTYDDVTWTLESSATQPLTVYGASAAFEPTLETVILFGGADGGVDQNRTWSWTGSNWVELFPGVSPPAREGAGIVWDKALGRIILVGGQLSEVPTGDT